MPVTIPHGFDQISNRVQYFGDLIHELQYSEIILRYMLALDLIEDHLIQYEEV